MGATMATEPVVRWEIVTCTTCHRPFPRGEAETYKRTCIPCFKTGRNYAMLIGDHALGAAQDELARLATQVTGLTGQVAQARRDVETAKAAARVAHGSDPATVFRARLGKLLLLCHPDKHGNSSESNEVTKWLLTLRKR